MNIPNDTGYPWRLHKFVEYQHRVRSIHPITLCEYSNRKNLNEDDCIFLSWLLSVTYSEITSIFLFEKIDWKTMTPEFLEEFWTEHKSTLIFGSARKYAKSMDWFVPLMNSFLEITDRKPKEWLRQFVTEDSVETYQNIEKFIRKVKYVGRFASDLFLEMLIAFNKIGRINIVLEQPLELDWKNCANLTSAVFNILYMDEEADLYDKTGRVDDKHIPLLNKEIQNIQKTIQERYPEQESSIPLVIGKLCSYRNLFKSTRYGGFHHDRQLGNIIQYEKNYPQDKQIWDMCYDMRSYLFHESLLGEKGGWTGIRKERKKLFVQEGKTGVEEVPDHATKELKEIRVVQPENAKNTTQVKQKPTILKSKTNAQSDSIRQPIFGDTKTLIVDPYAYRETKQVNREHPKLIKKLANEKKLELCYYPVEPFHYREEKRHATENAMKVCVEHDIPMSVETRRAVPDWAVDYLSRNKMSEVRIHLSTLDESKWRKLFTRKEASSPEELLDSFIRCFNGGIYTILKIAPIVPTIIQPADVFKVLDTVKNWIEQAEVSFASFSLADLALLQEKLPNEYEEIMKRYELVGDRYCVDTEYREKFLQKLYAFSSSYKLELKPVKELKEDENGNVTVMKIKE